VALHRAGKALSERVHREVGFAALRVNARLRDEFLNETIFTSLAHARQELEAWRHDYNHFRPHSSLGNRTPTEMGSGSTGKPYWGHAPNTVVAITPGYGYQNGHRLYS
jgi:putative transposase